MSRAPVSFADSHKAMTIAPPRLVMGFTKNDGGRAAAGYKGLTNDCVTRAIAIATKMSYQEAYELIRAQQKREGRKDASPRKGSHKDTTKAVLASLGFVWKPTMLFGQGCRVHMLPGELPSGTLIVRLSKHIVTVIDHVIHDTYDCSRGGRRCVYGYWYKPSTS